MKSQCMTALLLSVFIVGCSKLFGADLTDSYVIGRLQWGSMDTYIKTNSGVFNLEEDALIPGNILFSSYTGLMTTNGKPKESVQLSLGEITAFFQANYSHIIFVMMGRPCVFYLNRLTSQKSPFVGNCTHPVSQINDGQYGSARFHTPIYVMKDQFNQKAAIVLDRYAYALRSIDLFNGMVKTLYKGLPNTPEVASFGSDKEIIFIVFPHALGKFNMKSLTYTHLTLYDDFSKASLSPYSGGIMCMNRFCILGDQFSNTLRIVDVDKHSISSICTSTGISVDGTPANCSLSLSRGLMLKSGFLYIGGRDDIKRIPVTGFSPCDDIALQLSPGERQKCIQIMPGHSICLPSGISMYSIPEKNCTIKINITKEYDICQNNPCLNSGICKVDKDDIYTCSCRKGWTGRICQTEINACSFNPCKNSGRCLAFNNTFTCSCMEGWSGIICEKDIRNNKCLSEIFGIADVKTMEAEITLPVGDRIKLPVGRFIYQQQLPDGTVCEMTVTVTDPRFKTRIDFIVNYQLPCDLLHQFNDLTRSLAMARYSQIRGLSSEMCNQSTDADVMLSCTKDVAQVVWPTDCIFDSSQLSEKEITLKVINGNLQKTKVFHLDLVIPSHSPPIILPLLNQDGLPVSVLQTPVCSGGLTYVNMTNTCS